MNYQELLKCMRKNSNFFNFRIFMLDNLLDSMDVVVELTGSDGVESESDLKLTIPGIRSKIRAVPPSLERLESCVSSPCVSDATLTSRRLRELIPCTPSPLYAYDLKFAASSSDTHGRLMPRFFPFPVSGTDQGAVIQVGNLSLTECKSESVQSPQGSHSSTNQCSGFSSLTVSPNGLKTPITTPITNSICSVKDNASLLPYDTSAILTLLKPSLQPDGSFDLEAALKCVSSKMVMEDAVELCKDQQGSRFLQQLINSDRLSASSRNVLFCRVLSEAKLLTTDPFGNYVVQKLVDCATANQRSELFAKLKGSIFTLSIHMFGCRVVQRLIECSSIQEQQIAAAELKGHVIECVEDQNGNHVIQKLIEKVPSEHLDFIVGEFLGQITVMATHCYGCRVVQRLLEKLNPQDSTALIGEILANLWRLSQDQYGNYVVQHVLVHGTNQHRSVILRVIASHIIDFSCHKYASNIAEKALLCAQDQPSRDLLIGAVIGSGGPDAPLHVLMKDRFANYVIQRCIEFSHGTQRETLVQILRVQLPSLKRVIYGKHIATAVERILH